MVPSLAVKRGRRLSGKSRPGIFKPTHYRNSQLFIALRNAATRPAVARLAATIRKPVSRWASAFHALNDGASWS